MIIAGKTDLRILAFFKDGGWKLIVIFKGGSKMFDALKTRLIANIAYWQVGVYQKLFCIRQPGLQQKLVWSLIG